MNKTIIALMMEGYDVLFNNLRTVSGLLHPDAKDYIEVILQKRLPGLTRKGGAAYKKMSVRWDVLEDPKRMEDIFLKMKASVDRTLVIEKAKRKL